MRVTLNYREENLISKGRTIYAMQTILQQPEKTLNGKYQTWWICTTFLMRKFPASTMDDPKSGKRYGRKSTKLKGTKKSQTCTSSRL